jgi:hypothetical protein
LQFEPFAAPGIRTRAGRRVQPIARIGKCLTKNLEILVAGVIIAIESEESGRVCGGVGLRIGERNGDRSYYGKNERNWFHADDVIATSLLRSSAQRCDTFFTNSPNLIKVSSASISAFSHPSAQKLSVNGSFVVTNLLRGDVFLMQKVGNSLRWLRIDWAGHVDPTLAETEITMRLGQRLKTMLFEYGVNAGCVPFVHFVDSENQYDV